MIIVRLNLWKRVKVLFGWQIEIQLSPNTAQSYFQYMIAPWEESPIETARAEAAKTYYKPTGK